GLALLDTFLKDLFGQFLDFLFHRLSPERIVELSLLLLSNEAGRNSNCTPAFIQSLKLIRLNDW
ncbi:MAG: hypothetical protein JXA18_16930, partial [Chitinispirillaceae bacterium]|nr:hypothetical protein [Chitinispirillaceae bacterium]